MKRILYVSLALLVLLVLLTSALAGNAPTQPSYLYVEGTVTQIADFTDSEGKPEQGHLFVTIATESGEPAVLEVLPEDTRVLSSTDTALSVGDYAIGFFDATRPMLMIYPPRYTAVMLFVNPDGNAPDSKTESDSNTESDDKSESDDQTASETDRATTLAFTIDGQTVDAPLPFMLEDGTVYAPLQPVASAFDMPFDWDGQSSVVLIGQWTIVLGEDSYALQRRAPESIGAPALLIDGAAYAPLSFFRDQLSLNNAYLLEGTVFIDNGEKMQ